MTILVKCLILTNYNYLELFTPGELQSALILISSLVIVASLLFAGYIFITNDKSGKGGARKEDNNLMSGSGDKQDPDDKTAVVFMPPDDLVKNQDVPKTDKIAPLQISELKIQPSRARPGEKIQISFTATNIDSLHAQYGLFLKIDGRVFDISEIRILPGLSLHMDFQVFLMAPGTHTADVNGSTGLFTIVK